MTQRISKENPGTTERLDHLRDFVNVKDTLRLGVQ